MLEYDVITETKAGKEYIPADLTSGPTSKHKDVNSLEKGDKFHGTIITGNRQRVTGTFTVKEVNLTRRGDKKYTLENTVGEQFKTTAKAITSEDLSEKIEKHKALMYSMELMAQPVEIQMKELAEAGIRNIWMVGPAGCGKSTMARNVAKFKNLPYLCISCGIGTSSSEFVGYKYPQREATKFSEYYAKPSIILIDEITALDPAVAQVLNAALANDEIETTTGLVHRHPECIIIATSNTFGQGGSRQYVANNQLDASTIDRFVGGIIEVDYSKEYEKEFDEEVVTYVRLLRKVIRENNLRRIASTRMVIEGSKLKARKIRDWKKLLIINWTDSEKGLANSENASSTLLTKFSAN